MTKHRKRIFLITVLLLAAFPIMLGLRTGCAVAHMAPAYAREAQTLQVLNAALDAYREETGQCPESVEALVKARLAGQAFRTCCTLRLGPPPDYLIPYEIDRSGETPRVVCPRHGATPTQEAFMKDVRDNIDTIMQRQQVWK